MTLEGVTVKIGGNGIGTGSITSLQVKTQLPTIPANTFMTFSVFHNFICVKIRIFVKLVLLPANIVVRLTNPVTRGYKFSAVDGRLGAQTRRKASTSTTPE